MPADRDTRRRSRPGAATRRAAWLLPALLLVSGAALCGGPARTELLWSDPSASPTATFQSHVDKLLLDGRTLRLAYAFHRADGGSSNRVVSLDLDTGEVTGRENRRDSNSGCLTMVGGRALHVYEDYLRQELLVDRLDASPARVVPGVNTAGKITCAGIDNGVYVGTSYGAVYRLTVTGPEGTTIEQVRADLELSAPEFAQYPHLAVIPTGLLVFNNTILDGWHYLDLLLSTCLDGCSDFQRLLPDDVSAANSWVGDVFASDAEHVVVFYSTNDSLDSENFFAHTDDNIGHVGWFERGKWRSQRLGPRMLSGKLIERDGELSLVTMTQTGRVTRHIVNDGTVEQVAAFDLGLDCAYALDAILADGSLFVAVTDRGSGCFGDPDRGTAQLWRLRER